MSAFVAIFKNVSILESLDSRLRGNDGGKRNFPPPAEFSAIAKISILVIPAKAGIQRLSLLRSFGDKKTLDSGFRRNDQGGAGGGGRIMRRAGGGRTADGRADYAAKFSNARRRY